LVTRDHGFANTILYPPKQFHGIIVLHIHPPKAEKLVKGMERLLAKVEICKGKLLIVKDEVIEVVEDGGPASRDRGNSLSGSIR